jgi:hypothetical protein
VLDLATSLEVGLSAVSDRHTMAADRERHAMAALDHAMSDHLSQMHALGYLYDAHSCDHDQPPVQACDDLSALDHLLGAMFLRLRIHKLLDYMHI